jgi:hypothetical protein
MSNQAQQIQQIKDFLKVAKVRAGLPFEVIAIQKDLNGNPNGLRGTVDVPNDKGGFQTQNLLWEWNGRYPTNPMLDLIVEETLTEVSDSEPEIDTTQPESGGGEEGGGEEPPQG